MNILTIAMTVCHLPVLRRDHSPSHVKFRREKTSKFGFEILGIGSYFNKQNDPPTYSTCTVRYPTYQSKKVKKIIPFLFFFFARGLIGIMNNIVGTVNTFNTSVFEALLIGGGPVASPTLP